jgi:tRNA (adenine22-N1)-methyltransferase
LALKPNEADIITVCGLGGMKIIEMLEKSPEVARSVTKLIFQPQRDAPKLRKALHEAYFKIEDEFLVREQEFFYIILIAVPAAEKQIWTETEYRLGKNLISKKGKDWHDYLMNELTKIERYINEATPEKRKILDAYIQEMLTLT